MNVLLITGDKRFKPRHPRYELQKSAVERLEVVYWGRMHFWPKLPKGSFDVVTVQDPFWRGLFGWLVARRLRVPLNVQVHADLAKASLVKHILAQIVLRHANSVRAVSEKIRHQVLSVSTDAPVRVLPVYIDLEKFKDLRREQHDTKTVLWVGRFEEEKDPMRAIDIVRELNERGTEIKLIMLGAGRLEQRLRTSATGLPVEFVGWQDPTTYLAQADVVLCTSKEESYGASIIEALAAGVPVVAPDVGVAREAGAVVVQRNDLAEGVLRVLQLGERGVLKLPLYTKEEWSKLWRESLRA